MSNTSDVYRDLRFLAVQMEAIAGVTRHLLCLYLFQAIIDRELPRDLHPVIKEHEDLVIKCTKETLNGCHDEFLEAIATAQGEIFEDVRQRLEAEFEILKNAAVPD